MSRPRVIVLDGLNGVGKSAAARVLSARLGIPIIRPFRHADANHHLGREPGRGTQRTLRGLGIPANTFVDDIYTADLVTALNASALLDRSMPSAVAYGLLYKDVSDLNQALALVDEWQRMWTAYQGDFVYVHMVADQATMRERLVGRWAPDSAEERKLDNAFRLVYRWLRVRKVQLDTTKLTSPEDTAERILEAFRADAR